MTVFQFIVAICGVTISIDNVTGQRMLVAFVCLYISSFALTWGTVAWVVNAEIFPLSVRAKAMSMTGASNWAVNFAIGYAIPYLVNDGPGNAGLGVKVFFMWGSLCAFCGIYSCTSTVVSLTSPLTLHLCRFLHPRNQGFVSRTNQPAVPQHYSSQVGGLPQRIARQRPNLCHRSSAYLASFDLANLERSRKIKREGEVRGCTMPCGFGSVISYISTLVLGACSYSLVGLIVVLLLYSCCSPCFPRFPCFSRFVVHIDVCILPRAHRRLQLLSAASIKLGM